MGTMLPFGLQDARPGLRFGCCVQYSVLIDVLDVLSGGNRELLKIRKIDLLGYSRVNQAA